MEILEPNARLVRQRLMDWEEGNLIAAEATTKLVFETWPANTDLAQILAKVIVLNRLYSTNIFNPYVVAQHILTLNIDPALGSGDVTVVAKIARVRFGERSRFLLSFASKYCAWHKPDHFQILDSLVERLLWEYRRRFNFAEFDRSDLRDYPRFVMIVDQFREHFALREFTNKEIDKFLWYEARELWGARGITSATASPVVPPARAS